MSKEERFIYHCDNYDYADIIYDTKEYQECDSMQMATNWLNRQDQQLTLTEKALELACETIKSMCPNPLWIGGTIPAPKVKDAEYFKEIAKEMIKSE